MNKIIIIGNGFDLAHGLKTRYVDFINDYLNSVLLKVMNTNAHNDKLLEIYSESTIIMHSPDISDKNGVRIYSDAIKVYRELIDSKRHITKKYLSPLLQGIIQYSDSAPNWYDLEQMYFDLLYKKVNTIEITPERTLDEFLNQFDHIRDLLIEYLKKIELEESSALERLKSKYLELFTAGVVKTRSIKEDNAFSHLYFLNFNYTPTLNWYINEVNKQYSCNTDTYYFHGDLDNKFGAPIFGFGDVQDKKYQEILRKNNDNMLRHIKPFKYLDSYNLNRLNAIIGQGQYEVDVFGHSLGLSDRTILNSIFENEACEKINLYFYQNDKGDDYINKVANIARIFVNQTSWLNKIESKVLSSPMPQLSDFK